MPRHKCVLLVDDDSVDNLIHSEVLRENDFAERIDVATTGSRALQYFLEGRPESDDYYPPDVVFLDINMPMMNGFEFLDAFQGLEDDRLRTTRIYMLSSSENPRDQARADTSDLIKGFLVKPLTEHQLSSL